MSRAALALPAPLLAVLAGVGVYLVWRQRSAQGSAGALEQGATVPTQNQVAEWTSDAELLPDAAPAALDALVKVIGPVHVSSGVRGVEQQAAAMIAKHERYLAALERGETPAESDNLNKLYKDKEQVQDLFAVPYDQWPLVLEGYASRGRPISRHMWSKSSKTAGAIDLRTRPDDISGMTDEAVSVFRKERAKLISDGISKVGGKALVESDHVHWDLPALVA